jgi:hypothetical protein
MTWSGRWAIVLALVVGLAGCSAKSDRATPGPAGRVARNGQPDHGDRRTAIGSDTPPGPALRGARDDVEDVEPHASRAQVSNARSIARAFLTTYVAFLYGRLPVQRIAGVDPNLRRELEQGHATTTPAERAARPRIEHLSLSPAGPPVSAVALATVTTGCCTPSHLSATLEPHRGGWVVVAVNG